MYLYTLEDKPSLRGSNIKQSVSLERAGVFGTKTTKIQGIFQIYRGWKQKDLTTGFNLLSLFKNYFLKLKIKNKYKYKYS